MLRALARELQEIDWSSTLKVTSDYVIYAHDLIGGRGAAEVKRAASPERVRALRRSGWLK